MHLGIDAETLEVRAIEGEQASATSPSEPANGSRVGDGPLLPRLREQIPAEEPIGTVTADGACDTRSSHAASAARQARAVIPTRRNGRLWRETTPGAQARNDLLRASRRLGRDIWRSRSGHRRRRPIKAKMRGLTRLGEQPSARTSSRQTARPPDRQTARPPDRRASEPRRPPQAVHSPRCA